ncbi:MAG: type IV pilus modification protein PilV [endosymbiont of Galathealinum brachiosum]|uniref:Type IV pilus modification protein PilV n=1 Tax=endosymbiont of Galathealinum brachiosum TaxID=2200906 RepID=A0A370DCJ2_9GAMM|nr:MAG: type IV pilus modification protein PilV [endosymbiont of Galathealinum brachiosum]
MKKLFKAQQKQQGFTFLESLLALFILSIGLLGVAGMHAQAMKTGYVATQNMSVVLKGEELIERMRANPVGLADYAGAAASYGCTSGSTCLPAQMAADDLFIWQDDLNAILPAPTIEVLVNTIPEDPAGDVREVTINIDWSTKNINYSYSTVAEIWP